MSVEGLDLLSQASIAPLEKAVAAKYDLNSEFFLVSVAFGGLLSSCRTA